MRRIALLSLAVAFCGCLTLLLITFNVLQHTALPLHRFRETTWVVHAALLGWMLAWARGLRRGGELRRRIAAIAASRRFFFGLMGVMLGLYLMAAITQHLAFRTFSHDFTMIDDALYNTHSGRWLYSSLLQRSFLAEHFSPILLLLAPLHAMFTTPWFLVIVQPVALWISALILKRVLDQYQVSPAWRNIVLLVYLNHPVMISTLSYLFHMECLLPACVFALVLCHRRNNRVGLVIATLMALAIKEDIGIYLIGVAVWVAFVERRWRRGSLLALASAGWTFLAVYDWMPRFHASPSAYAFLERWSAWGDGPLSIGLGYLRHPLRLVESLLRDPVPRYLACLGLLPLLKPSAVALWCIPLVLNTTSSNVQQSSLSLYYGMPFLAFAVIASILGLKSALFARLAAQRWSFAVGGIVIMLNVAHFTYPEIPLDRFALQRHIHAIPPHASVQAMSCFFPVLDYARPKELVAADSEPHAEYLLLRRRGGTWPLSAPEVARMLGEARCQSYDTIYESADFAVLRRAAVSATALLGAPAARAQARGQSLRAGGGRADGALGRKQE